MKFFSFELIVNVLLFHIKNFQDDFQLINNHKTFISLINNKWKILD
jgi:hypothetical protein